MYRQSFLEKPNDTLLRAIPLERHIEEMQYALRHPFRKPGFFDAVLRVVFHIKCFFLIVAQKLAGVPLYFRNEWGELLVIRADIRRLLIRLIKSGFIVSWKKVLLTPDVPPVVSCTVQLGQFKTSSSESAWFHSYVTGGCGNTIDEALIRAIAEAFERHSLSVWDHKKILHDSFVGLQHRGAVNPQTFAVFSEMQLAQEKFSSNRVLENDTIGWVSARSLTEKKDCLVPAQLVYITYRGEHQNEPWFMETTTNGSAAATSYDEAAYRALCEAIERDSFLIFWLNKIAPPHINLSTIHDADIQKSIQEIKTYKLELHLLDLMTDLGVPVIGAVLLDHSGEVAVTVGLVADFDITVAIKKLLLEAIKLLHVPINKEKYTEVETRYPFLKSISDHRIAWSGKNMLPRIDFFISNTKEKSVASVHFLGVSEPRSVARMPYRSRVNMISDLLKKKGYHVYLIEATSPFAKKEGLSIVRAIVPELVPIYFDEEKKYLGIKRLYEAPVAMGYLKKALREDELNTIPHPFA